MEALFGAFIGGLITFAITLYTTQANSREARRKSRQDFLVARMDKLSESVAEYEEYLATYPDPPYTDEDKSPHIQHAKIIGKAVAVCLSVSDLVSNADISDENIKSPDDIPDLPDIYRRHDRVQKIHRLAYIANHRLTRNFVREPKPEDTQKFKESIGDKERAQIAKGGIYQNRNRHALDHAMKRLGHLIAETQNDRVKNNEDWRY